MKQIFLLFAILFSACSSINNGNTLLQTSSSSTSSKNSFSANVSSAVSSIFYNTSSFSNTVHDKYLTMPKYLPSEYIDIAIPISGETDFYPGKAEIDLRINENILLTFYTKNSRFYAQEEHKNWQFNQNEFIYDGGELIKFDILDQIQRQDLTITKVTYLAWHGTTISYILKHDSNYTYIIPSKADNISEVDKIVYGIELAKNVPSDKIVESNLTSHYWHSQY